MDKFESLNVDKNSFGVAEYIDFEFEKIKDSILDSKVIKKDKLNLIIDYLENSNDLEGCLLSSNGKTTLMKKLSTKWNYLCKSKKLLDFIYSNPRVLLEALKGKMDAVLDGAPSSVYSMLLDGRPLIEHIFESKIVKMNNVCSLMKFPNIFNYLKKYKFPDIDLIDLNNYLLDENNGKLLLDELINSDVTKIYRIYNNDIIQEIINRKAFYLLNNVKYSFFLNNYVYKGSERRLLDIIYDNNISLSSDTLNDIFLYAYFPNDFGDILDIMYHYKKYDDLSSVKFEFQILHLLPSGKTVLEELFINHKYKNSVKHFSNSKSISLILDYNVVDLYKYVDISSWLKNADLNNTYLDILLDKNEDIEYDELFFDMYEYSPYLCAKIIMTFAKHNMLDKINCNLFYDGEEFDKSVLDYLMDIDSEFTLNNILSENDKKKYDVALITTMHEFKNKTFGLNVSVNDTISEYQEKKYESCAISEEQQQLLNEFYDLMNDGNSSMELVGLCITAYKKLFYDNNPAAYDIVHLINYKKKFPTFKIVEHEYSSFSPLNTAVFLSSKSIKVMMHELGHVIHWEVGKDATPDGFDELISDGNFFSKADKHYRDLKELIKNTKQQCTSIIANMYSKNISHEYLKSVEEFLNKGNYSKSVISRLLSSKKIPNLSKYIQKDISIKSNILSDFYIKNDDNNMTQIYDILDAVTFGESSWSYGLAYGHGSAYYKKDKKLIFCEVFADYCSIIKSPDSEFAISILRKYVGDELVDFLDNYYKKTIIKDLIYDDNHNL